MARALSRSDTLFRILELAAEEARLAIDAASVSVSRLEIGTLNVRTIVNVGDLGPHEVRWPEYEFYALDEFENLAIDVDALETWRFDVDSADCPPGDRDLLRLLDKGCSLASPIVVDGRLWGEFYATRHRDEPTFDDSDVACLEVLVAVMAGAISRALKEASLEQLAFKDPLTGLFNRRVLDEQA
ncbi:MAG: GAF domain-containing protein, partial [Nocardioidaceae bacterium]